MTIHTPGRGSRREWAMSGLWAVARIWVGWQFLMAALEKVGSPEWTGAHAGVALRGFLGFAVSPQMTGGPHPSVLAPYVWLTDHVFMPNAVLLSYLVTAGELLVGIGLMLGILTRAAALGGLLLNLNYMFAGAAGLNAPMLPIELSIVLVGTTAGLIGLDAVILPYVRLSLRRLRLRPMTQFSVKGGLNDV